MNRVIDSLYIGNIHDALCTDTLLNNHITHILTVDMKPLPLESHEAFTYMHCYAKDTEQMDLLNKMDSCIQFIDAGRDAGGRVLVHCQAGQSRSAAIILAYLMQTLSMSLADATSLLTQHRPQIRPNAGFLSQLQLFEEMACKIDRNNELFRRYELSRLTKTILNRGCVEEHLTKDCLQSDPGVTTSQLHEVIYRCRKCRRALFRNSCVIYHETGRGEAAFDWRAGLTPSGQQEQQCRRSLFIEPVGWMQTAILSIEGKLLCPKCSAKLGSFNWAGDRCPCGTWVTPAFHVQNSKVDKCAPPVQMPSHIQMPSQSLQDKSSET